MQFFIFLLLDHLLKIKHVIFKKKIINHIMFNYKKIKNIDLLYTD